MTLDALNVADQATFVTELGSIFEDSPWVAERTWLKRPFASVDALHAAMCAEVSAASPEAQLKLIRAHPVLGGQAALRGQLSASSAEEQASAGLDHVQPKKAEQLAALNKQYAARFGFPFILCVRNKSADTIVSTLRSRLNAERAPEIATALAEIAEIAHFRLTATVAT